MTSTQKMTFLRYCLAFMAIVAVVCLLSRQGRSQTVPVENEQRQPDPPSKTTPKATPRPWVRATPQRDPFATPPTDAPEGPEQPAPQPSVPAPEPGTPQTRVVGPSKAKATFEAESASGGAFIVTGYNNSFNFGSSGEQSSPKAPAASPQREAVPPATERAPSPQFSANSTQEKTVDISQAARVELTKPGYVKRQWYALFPGHKHLATPKAQVANGGISLPVNGTTPPASPQREAAAIQPQAPTKCHLFGH